MSNHTVSQTEDDGSGGWWVFAVPIFLLLIAYASMILFSYPYSRRVFPFPLLLLAFFFPPLFFLLFVYLIFFPPVETVLVLEDDVSLRRQRERIVTVRAVKR